jgi:hypothetical protein
MSAGGFDRLCRVFILLAGNLSSLTSVYSWDVVRRGSSDRNVTILTDRPWILKWPPIRISKVLGAERLADLDPSRQNQQVPYPDDYARRRTSWRWWIDNITAMTTVKNPKSTSSTLTHRAAAPSLSSTINFWAIRVRCGNVLKGFFFLDDLDPAKSHCIAGGSGMANRDCMSLFDRGLY